MQYFNFSMIYFMAFCMRIVLEVTNSSQVSFVKADRSVYDVVDILTCIFECQMVKEF